MDNLSANSAGSDITHVSDTALWVAVYRANESKRSDSLFNDFLADRLVGERGRQIEQNMAKEANIAKYLSWSVVIRTYIIDQFILEKVKEGIDTVINLGAGLDTRPYRMDLPANLKWIEIDFPQMIQYKESHIKNEIPRCQLERISLDLSSAEAKKEAFAKIASQTTKALIITEGVVPYLDEDQVNALIEDLNRHKQFQYWIVEYFTPAIMKNISQRGKLFKLMKNSPLKFFPENLLEFFNKRGWEVSEIRYFPKESQKVSRGIAMPWWARVVAFFLPPSLKEKFLNNTGFMILKPKP